MTDTYGKVRKKRPRRVAAPTPTTDDPLELAMEAAATGRAPSGAVQALIASQNRLVGWQIATGRAAFARKSLTVSVGVAFAPGGAPGILEMVSLADGAMYDAKRAGRNRIEICEVAPGEM